ncbi:MAG TPA: outer membrane protein assembly factor BamD [Terrimicrobiaceae bacterium]|jgi:outer membrane protein assembly factor BamD|nr:outer membrane protein assembly factor BamD [Terrimicrobiaceae bacterium]
MFCRVLAPFLFASALLSSVVAQYLPSQVERSSLGTVYRAPEFTDEASAFQAAEDFYAAKNYEGALGTYKRFLKAYPSSKLASKAQLQVADILLLQGRWNASFDAYQTLITRYPDTPEFEGAVARQVLIANSYLDMRKVMVLGYGVPVPGITGIEQAAKMYEKILRNAPYSIYAPITQFNLGLAFQRARKIKEAREAYQKVLDKYPNSDVCDDALYQIAYIYMQLGLTSSSQDLSALVLARETFEDFLLQYPQSEKAPQARDNLKTIGNTEAGNLMEIAKWYDWSKDYKAAVIYYNDVVRKQPRTHDAELAKTRIEELRSQYGDDVLRVGSERAESGEKVALRRRLQAQVETSALANYDGPSKRDIVPEELPVVKQPRLRTDSRDIQPIEPLLPTQ